MKTTAKAIALTLALAALPGLAQMGIYSFGIGPFNNASNSNYTTTTGYYAGGGAQGDSRTSLYGSMAGLYSAYVQRSVGIGAGAFYMASNCYDCVAIGDGAGAKWRNATGWVQVGDVLAYTNGYLYVKAPAAGYDIGGILRNGEGGDLWLCVRGEPCAMLNTGYASFVGDLYLVRGEHGGTLYCGGIEADGYCDLRGDVWAHSLSVSYLQDIHIGYGSEAESLDEVICGNLGNSIFRFENGELAVYTNGVKAGKLAFTPAQ